MSFWRARKHPRVTSLVWKPLYELVRREAAAALLREYDPRTEELVQRRWVASIGGVQLRRLIVEGRAPASYALTTPRTIRRLRRIARVRERGSHGHGCRFCGVPWNHSSTAAALCRLPKNALCPRCERELRNDEGRAPGRRPPYGRSTLTI